MDFTHNLDLSAVDTEARQLYDRQAGEIYENAMRWLWESFCENEARVRSDVLDVLDVRPDHKVLEIGCGTGADSETIAYRMGGGELFLQDISTEMLDGCSTRFEKLEGVKAVIELSVAEADRLPFCDAYFDRVFHFGGLNTFGNIARTLQEMARVTRVGGQVVVGDESLAPWLRGSEFGRIVTTNNPLYEARAPVDKLPENSRDVCIRYIIGNCFYLVSFTVGDGPPPLNLDLPHKGKRGGTLRTRYYGVLEGVTVETKGLVQAAAEANGKSVHDWLEEVLRDQATKRMGQGHS